MSTMKRDVAAIAFLLIALHGRGQAELVQFGGPTMGTTYHVRIVAESSAVSIAGLKAKIEALLADIDRQMSTYRPDSELSQFNRAPGGDWFPISQATAEIVTAAREISRNTDGALDVTVGPLVRLWHFSPQTAVPSGSNRRFTPPSDEVLSAARAHVGYQKLDVQLDPPALRKKTSALEVDLSSIAPGYTVDRMAGLLTEHRVQNFVVEIGGEVRVAGRRADGQPWRIAIERPLADRREKLLTLPLSDAAISTAGGYRKSFEHGGRRYSHIIDPATGRPVEHSLLSVTVVAETCLAADGWDTPLLVLGPARGYQCAEKHNIAAMFISRDLAGESEAPEKIETTPAWKARFAGENDTVSTPSASKRRQ